MASCASYRASGPAALSGRSRRTSGYGSSHVNSPSRVGSGGSTASGGTFAGGRLLAARSMFRQRLVAMRYNQVRIAARPWKPLSPRHAAVSVSCTASSASATEPRIR